MRRLGTLQPTREQVVRNQWQIIAVMKAAHRSHLTNVLRMVNAARRGIKIRTVPGM